MIRRGAPSGALALLLLLAACAPLGAAPSRQRSVCQRYASPTGDDGRGSGSRARPFRTPQRLVARLRPGQTGCLLTGRYAGSRRLTFTRGGAPGAPITLRSAPGHVARLVLGIVRIAPGASDVTLSDLEIDGSSNPDVTVWIQGDRARLARNAIGNGNAGMSCVIVGDHVRVTITRNLFHRCGTPAHGNQDHAIYASHTRDSRIAENVFWGTTGWAVHLYPDAQRTRVERNLIDDNGRGIVIGGDGATASSDNVVTRNVISNSRVEYLVQSYWGGAVGTGNRVEANCLFRGAIGTIVQPAVGFQASGNLIADPRYRDAAARDYRLRPGSRCLRLVGGDIASLLPRRLGAGAGIG